MLNFLCKAIEGQMETESEKALDEVKYKKLKVVNAI